MNWPIVLFINGALLTAIGGLMCLPLFLEFCFRAPLPVSDFLLPISGCIFIGLSLFFANKQSKPLKIGTTDAFLLTSLAWLLLPVFAGLPFYCCKPLNLSFIDSWYEGASALTTTGCTAVSDISAMPRWVVTWRLILSYVGGVGIILMGIIIFPILRIGGMQLFRAESSDQDEKLMPSVSQISIWIVGVYSGLIVVSSMLLGLTGMTLQDSIIYAVSTISTCGLMTPTDIRSLNNVWSELILILSMILGGSSLTLFVKAIKGNVRVLTTDRQVHGYLKVLLFFSMVAVFFRWYNSDLTFFDGLREGIFNSVSFITTTGLFNSRFDTWGTFPVVLFSIMSVIGGCTGSTSGGIKIFRFQILFACARTHVLQMRRPHGVFVATYNNQRITESVAISILLFIALYVFSVGGATLLLTMFGYEFTSAISASIAAIGNVGVGVGQIAGIDSVNADILPGAKVVLIACMVLGRLELMTLLTLLIPSFWKR
ncbi:MAG: hypothetical protein LBJ89_02400 [Holosporales bacterium]|jgi:trk system potassium uptake protein TrkH|nr:hypothetical protein [Holosporales bacterium]